VNVTRSFAVAATFAAVAVGAASPASAAPEMSGHYTETETAASDRSTTNHWYFAPCGDGCASVALKGAKAFGRAQVVGGQWTLDVTGETAMCQDGTQVPDALSSNDQILWMSLGEAAQVGASSRG
jgi:hypothetical protein